MPSSLGAISLSLNALVSLYSHLSLAAVASEASYHALMTALGVILRLRSNLYERLFVSRFEYHLDFIRNLISHRALWGILIGTCVWCGSRFGIFLFGAEINQRSVKVCSYFGIREIDQMLTFLNLKLQSNYKRRNGAYRGLSL